MASLVYERENCIGVSQDKEENNQTKKKRKNKMNANNNNKKRMHTSGLADGLNNFRKSFHQGEVFKSASFFQAVHLSCSFPTIFGGSPLQKNKSKFLTRLTRQKGNIKEVNVVN